MMNETRCRNDIMNGTSWNSSSESWTSSKLTSVEDYIVGSWLIITAVLSITLNTLLIVTVALRKRACQPVELFILNMAACDLLQACICLPVLAVAFYTHGNLIGKQICLAEGFLVFLIGCVSIWNLAAMSLLRYLRTCCDKDVTTSDVTKTIVACYAHSLVWCVAPVLGWGKYGPEPYGVTCSIDWTCSQTSYIAALFVCVYGIPLLVMLYCYSSMVCYVKNAQQNMSERVSNKQTYLTLVVMIMCLCFFVAWTPYAITALMYIGGVENIPYILTLGSPIFAKTSLWYNPVAYFFVVKRFRQDVMDVLNTRIRGTFLKKHPENGSLRDLETYGMESNAPS